MTAQIRVNKLLRNKSILNRFKGMPKVAIMENKTPILVDHLQLLYTHETCFKLVINKVVNKFYIKDDLLVIFI